MKKALLVGNSDGIGLATTRLLLTDGWQVTGVSRSPVDIDDPHYEHHQQDVAAAGYTELLKELHAAHACFDVAIYFVGIGLDFDLECLKNDREVVETNFVSMLRTSEVVVPAMVAAGGGHFVGLSSIADLLTLPEAPSYSASKAGMSSYLGALALAVRKHNVCVTNIRFGFVDTKMADAPIKPMMITADKAARLVMRCLRKRPMRFTYPKSMGLLGRVIQLPWMLRLWWG